MPLLGSFIIEVVLKPSFNFRSNIWKKSDFIFRLYSIFEII